MNAKISELKTEDSNSSVLLLLNSAIEAVECETVNHVDEAISVDDKPMVGENVPVVNESENVKSQENVNSEELDVNRVNRAKNVKFVWLGSSQRDNEMDGSNCKVDDVAAKKSVGSVAKGVKIGGSVKSVKSVKFTKKSVNLSKGGAKLVNSKTNSKDGNKVESKLKVRGVSSKMLKKCELTECETVNKLRETQGIQKEDTLSGKDIVVSQSVRKFRSRK